MATDRKTVWLKFRYWPSSGVTTLEECSENENGAFKVDLIRTPPGWKHDDRRGRIEGLKEAQAFTPADDFIYRWIDDRIAQLEKEIADGR
ncbi:MAG TPA: hypothetical protein VFW94_23440 [Candidatus Acidoferrales bacterium]|nr:hypothetical protein [Candidatus Acidoferrales bacterium]